MGKTFGYVRVSTSLQNGEHQRRQILSMFPSAIIYEETFTGRSLDRPVFNRLLKRLTDGDTLVLVSISRLSRDSVDGIRIYEELFNKGISLIFLNERHLDSDVYKKALSTKFQETGDNVDIILKAVAEYLKALSRQQIVLAFQQAEKEVNDLSERTKQGMMTAKIHGKQIGRAVGSHPIFKKEIEAKQKISLHSKDFGGTLTDSELIQLTGVSRKSYYKYKKELREASNN